MDALVDAAWFMVADTDYIDICPIGGVAREVASTNDRLRLSAEAVFESWVRSAVALLEDAGVPAEEARDLAITLVGAIEGGFLLARTQRDPEPLLVIGRQVRRLVEATLADVARRAELA